MEWFLMIFCVCLFVLLLLTAWKYISLKANIRRFSQELEKLKSNDYRQPIKVTDSDKDIAELAIRLNEHTEMRQQLENEFEQNKKQLGVVISGISHDFRTPLTASLGYLQMIEKSGELSGKTAEYLSIATQKNLYLKELSDEFFELTKVESNTGELQCEEVNLSNILTEMLLEQHSWIAEGSIRTDFDISDGILIEADPHYLKRILNNLMSNAQKYSSSYFGVALKQEEEDAVLCMSNTLKDNSSVNIERIFEPFYRMSARTSGGCGLGLYVVKLLCQRHGWKVEADINNEIFTVRITIC